MSEFRPDFELTDQSGTTEHFNVTLTTSNQSIPAVADKVISEFLVFVKPQLALPSTTAQISLDGGSNFFTVTRGGSLGWTPKGGVKQIVAKSSNTTLDVQFLINFEEY